MPEDRKKRPNTVDREAALQVGGHVFATQLTGVESDDTIAARASFAVRAAHQFDVAIHAYEEQLVANAKAEEEARKAADAAAKAEAEAAKVAAKAEAETAKVAAEAEAANAKAAAKAEAANAKAAAVKK